MSNILNPKPEKKIESTKHLNWMGGASYDIKDPIMRLRIAASSCFFGEPQYYSTDPADDRAKRKPAEIIRSASKLTDADRVRLRMQLTAIDPQEWRSMTPAQAMTSAIDAALDKDPEATLSLAVALRQADHIRTTPQVMLVRAAHHPKVRGTGIIRKYAQEIMQRADEPAVGLAYHIYAYGKDKPIPNSLKKAWATRLAKASEYDLAKYRLSDRSVKTVDVVNLVHAKSEAIGKLVKGELTTADETWESIISQGGSAKETWEKAIDKMGHMALLRNLRNFQEKNVDQSLYLGKLMAGAAGGKQLPFRYFSAYQAVSAGGKASGQTLDAIEQCLETSLGNLPRFPGRTMALCDNSGSARGAATSTMGTMKVATIANLTAVIAGKVSDDGYIGVFGDGLETRAVRKKSSVFDQLKEAEKLGEAIGASTENGIWLFWDKAIREKEHWDNVFVMSDMQAGHGGLYGTRQSMQAYAKYAWPDKQHIDVSKLINEYRSKVNPKVNVFLIQVAGYQDTILPEFYNRTYILGGWGEGVLKFAAAMAGIGEPQQ
jgi:hypothetical protein